MVLKLNPNHQSVWRTPKAMQVGLDDAAVVFESISQPQEKLIAALYAGVSESQFEAFASQNRVTPSEAKSLLRRLEPLMLTPEPPPEPRGVGRPRTKGIPEPLSSAGREAAFSELIRASLLNGREPEAVFDERVRRMIHIDSLDRTGLSIVGALAAAGVGTFVTSDVVRVSSRDVGPVSYPAGLVGQTRLAAADWILKGSPTRARLVAAAKLASSTLDTLDAAVLVSQQVLLPARYKTWMTRSTAHMAVVFDSSGVWVSPVIKPGEPGCLLCFDKRRSEADSSWSAIATQLRDSQLRFDDAASQLFAAAMVTKALTAQFDSTAPTPGVRFNALTGEVRELDFGAHPDCECWLEPQLGDKPRGAALETRV